MNTKVKRLVYQTNTDNCDELYHILTLLPNLRFLKINGEGICRYGIMAINNLKRLKHLKLLQGTSLLFKTLSTQAVEIFEVHRFPDKYDEHLKLFAVNNPTIRELILWSDYGCMVAGSDLIFMATKLSNLTVLKVKTLLYTPGIIRLVCKHSRSLKSVQLYVTCKLSLCDYKFIDDNTQIDFEVDYDLLQMYK